MESRMPGSLHDQQGSTGPYPRNSLLRLALSQFLNDEG